MTKPTLIALAALLAALQLNTAWAAAAVKDTPAPKRQRPVAKKAPVPVAAPVAAAVEDEVLSEDQLAAAQRVNHGDAQCEFNQTVKVVPHPQRAGLFQVLFKNQIFTMAPEPTTTGAVRLEDKRNGMMWLQIPTKSMLMNSRIGQRMVDSCTHSEQRALIAANAANPTGGSGIGIVPVTGPIVATGPRSTTNIVTNTGTDGTATPDAPPPVVAAGTPVITPTR
ncbi:hypothetical protein [Roseateles toxinivorans]|uniref:Uncharacterized protein n=1 Tax=Roseateles toxinivorans TaxID=270368 RepID=A0A4R6QRR9_9BURK|nr:hypothetical protein [Roseateles toxinivorans]TDP74007.1 hypothetical protein DES47_10153 [Roseateles toxinivorans]